MKKALILILAAGMLMTPAMKSLCFAEEEMQGMQNEGQGGQDMQPMDGNEGNQQGGGSRNGNQKMKHMMGMMGGKESLVATSDGGVVVLAGPKLIKYDKDLNLVKEVEMKRGKGPGREGAQNKPAASAEAEAASAADSAPQP